MSGVLAEPLSAVVVKVVVDLVSQGGAVVVSADQLPGQVHPLPPDLLRVGEDLVAGVLPALPPPVLPWWETDLCEKLIKRNYQSISTHPVIKCDDLFLLDVPPQEESLPASPQLAGPHLHRPGLVGVPH